METCREARKQGLLLDLPYFTMIRDHFYTEHHLTKNYMNVDKDIVWIVDPHYDISGIVDFLCSKCPEPNKSHLRADFRCLKCRSLRLRGLMLGNYNKEESQGSLSWSSRGPSSPVSAMLVIQELNVQTLYLDPSVSKRPNRPLDATLVTPTFPAGTIFKQHPNKDWDFWTTTAAKELEEYNQQQIRRVQRIIDVENEERTKRHQYIEKLTERLDYLSNWTVPPIQFVGDLEIQSASLQRDWIRRPGGMSLETVRMLYQGTN